MEIKKAKADDLPLIEELLVLSNQNDEYARGYPTGSLKGLEHEFTEIDQNLLDNFYVISAGLGVFGIFDAPWGLYLIGPLFKAQHYTAANVTDAINEITKLDFLRGRMLDLDANGYNKVMLQAISQLQIPVHYEGVAMHYAIGPGVPVPTVPQILDVSMDDEVHLSEVAQLFNADLEPWGYRGLEDLKECLSEGSKLSVWLENGEVVAALVWSWDEELNEGEIEYLCTARDFQGRGFGTALMNYASNQVRQIARESDEPTWYLDTQHNNTKAINFYQNYGFKIDHPRKVFKLQIP